MKVPLDGVAKAEAITQPVKGTAGLTYETIKGLDGVEQLRTCSTRNTLRFSSAAQGGPPGDAGYD